MALSVLNFITVWPWPQIPALLFLVLKKPANLENETLHNSVTLACHGSWVYWEYLMVEQIYTWIQTEEEMLFLQKAYPGLITIVNSSDSALLWCKETMVCVFLKWKSAFFHSKVTLGGFQGPAWCTSWGQYICNMETNVECVWVLAASTFFGLKENSCRCKIHVWRKCQEKFIMHRA